MDDEPSSGLSGPQRDALTEFTAGYITAGQLTERLAGGGDRGRREAFSARARGAAGALARRPARAPRSSRARPGWRRPAWGLAALITAAGAGVLVGVTVGSQPVPAAVHTNARSHVAVRRKHHRPHAPTTVASPAVVPSTTAPAVTPTTTTHSTSRRPHSKTTSTATTTNPTTTGTTTGSSTSTATTTSSTTTTTGPTTSTSTTTGTG